VFRPFEHPALEFVRFLRCRFWGLENVGLDLRFFLFLGEFVVRCLVFVGVVGLTGGTCGLLLLLELVDELLDLRIGQGLEPTEGEGRLLAEVEEHHRVIRGDPAQLVVEQTLVHDPDVLGPQVGEVDRSGDPRR